jgi:CYTH domain-containing protein
MSLPYKYARIEWERRFRMRQFPPNLDRQTDYLTLRDNYLTGTRLRLRTMESPEGGVTARKLTQKYSEPGQDAYQTVITNIYLDQAEYEHFRGLPGKRLQKRRYAYLHAGVHYSLDVFSGHLQGLLLCDVEAGSRDELLSIPPPPNAAEEVTEQPFYTGGLLVSLSAQDFQAWLHANKE